MDPLFSVEDRVAVVTGASSGLGRRFARVLYERGARVMAAARRVDALEQLAGECPGLRPVRVDMANPEDVDALVADAVGAHGRIDIVVNNAGTGTASLAVDDALDDFRHVQEVNVVGLFHLARSAARVMIGHGGGAIVNVASINGLVASTPFSSAAYCASKGAVVNLTRELACQWARSGIRVNALAPGYFPSEMTAAALDDDGSVRYLERNCPMGRVGREDELDGALLFLASDASSYCTGQVLVVDGGWTAR